MFSLLGMLVAIDAMAKGTVTPSDQITILCRKNGSIRRIATESQSDYTALNRACQESYPGSYYISTLNQAPTAEEQCVARGLKAACSPGEKAISHHGPSTHRSQYGGLVCYHCIPRSPRMLRIPE